MGAEECVDLLNSPHDELPGPSVVTGGRREVCAEAPTGAQARDRVLQGPEATAAGDAHSLSLTRADAPDLESAFPCPFLAPGPSLSCPVSSPPGPRPDVFRGLTSPRHLEMLFRL